MLQLTQADGGQITGVLSSIELSASGKLNSDNAPITGGTFDGEQLTLILHPSLFGTNISGTKKGNTIRFETVGSNGVVVQYEFQRSSIEEFNKYAGQLQRSAVGVVLGSALLNRTQVLRQTAQDAEQWISNAELHAQRIPNAKDDYEKIENKMRQLIARERSTANSVARSQISVMVIQGDVQGTQVDLQVDQLWDQSIGDSGININQKLASYPTSCGAEEFQKVNVNPNAIRNWESACHGVQTERAKFEPIYKHIMEQRADLKSFQELALSHRKALVDEANRIQ